MIVLENVEKSYDGRKVLRNINLTLESGKIYGILGKDFSGKTSLLKLMSGQIKVDSGSIQFEGIKIYEKPDIVENIALVREEGIGIDDLKVKKMMKLASIAYKNWDEDMKELLIEEFDIDLNQRFYKLTREKQTLVGVIIGIASRAEWTVFDEPTMGLSKVNTAKFCEIIRRDLIEHPRTIVISNNRIDSTANLFDEIIVLRDGRVIVHESAEELKSKLYYAAGQNSTIDIQIGKNIIFKEVFGGTTVLGIYDEIYEIEKLAYAQKGIDISRMPLHRAYSYFTQGYMEPEKEEEIEVLLKMYGDEEEPQIIIEHESEGKNGEKLEEDEILTVKSEVTQRIKKEEDKSIVETVSEDEITDEKDEVKESSKTIKEEVSKAEEEKVEEAEKEEKASEEEKKEVEENVES